MEGRMCACFAGVEEVNMACSRRHFCTLVLLPDTLQSTSILRGAPTHCLASPSLFRGYGTLSMGSWEVSGVSVGRGRDSPIRIREKPSRFPKNHAGLFLADSARRPPKSSFHLSRRARGKVISVSSSGRVGGNVRSVWKRASDLVKWFV